MAISSGLTRYEADYREVFDKANDGFLIHDLKTGQILDANLKVCEMYGYTLEELRTRDVAAISSDVAPYNRTTASDNLKLASGGSPQLFEWVARAKDGTLFWVEVSLKRVRIGEDERILAIVRDISDRKRAEDENQQLREALTQVSRLTTLGELAASLAHELNQPLTAILTNAQAALRMMQREDFDRNEMCEIVRDIASDDRRAANVIRRMRELLKRGQLTAEPLDTAELIDDVLTLVRVEVVLAHIRLQAKIDPDVPAVLGDRVQLQQVVLNLIVNALHALKAVPADRRHLTVTAAAEAERCVRIEVRDTGPGIPTAMMPILFEPFSTTKSRGLGLGLAICRTLIDAHHGRIWVESDSESGADTTFVVILPAAQKVAA